jgi:predicted NBD/HSP70 family sugar kinase
VEESARNNEGLARGESRFHRGTNQSGMRDQNERLILSLVREHGALAKSDIARMTSLSLQTISVIMRELENAGFLMRQEPLRGRVGQPSVPMTLDPEGAYFLGLKIGRRSAELVLIDFLGSVRAMLSHSYRYPIHADMVQFALRRIATMRDKLTDAAKKRIAGLGIATPFEIWNWVDAVGAPAIVLDDWRDSDIRAEIQSHCDFPVLIENDATAACGAELVFGKTRGMRDFVYFYIGAFAGGGIVLNGRLFRGHTGNAGALGSMPVPGPDGRPAQLIDLASIAMLEKALHARGMQASHLWTSPDNWGDLVEDLTVWIEKAAGVLAYAIVSSAAVIDFEAAIIEGWMPGEVRAQLVAAVNEALGKIDVEGLRVPQVREGTVGIHARALGGASLPLAARFLATVQV